jgi:hypothetical protein
MILAVLSLVLGLAAAPADVTGKWDGKVNGVRPDGTAHEDTVLLVLAQKDTTITGTIGGSDSDQHPITSGTIDGNKVSVVAKHAENGREYRLELTVEGDELKGTAYSGSSEVKLQARRRKD